MRTLMALILMATFSGKVRADSNAPGNITPPEWSSTGFVDEIKSQSQVYNFVNSLLPDEDNKHSLDQSSMSKDSHSATKDSAE